MGTNKNGKRQTFPTVTQTYLNRVRTSPDRMAFYSKAGAEWKGVTWKDHFNLVRSVSLGLLEMGVRAGENVCLISNTRLEWGVVDMGILGARGVTVPVYASNTPEETAYIINHCDARFVFVEDSKQLNKVLSVHDKLKKVEKIIVFDPASTAPHTTENPMVLTLQSLRDRGSKAGDQERFEKNLMDAKPSDIFTICYTSGTTGVPKGVVLPFDALASVTEDLEKVMGKHLSENDILLSFLPISHIFGKVESMLNYQFGWRVYYAESIEKLLLNMAEVSPTILVAVPRVFEKAYNRIKAGVDESPELRQKLFHWSVNVGRTYFGKIWEGKRPSLAETLEFQFAKRIVFKKVYARFGGKLRFCIAGGAPLPKEVGEFLRILGITILEGYGLTETCAPVTLNIPEAIKYGSIGRALPEVSLKIADDGEIMVKTRKCFREYFKNPDATKEVFTDGWFHTGDIGVLDDEGFVRITDRKKDLIVTSGGKNVAPQKIENLAKTHKYISQFVVFGDKRNYLTALITLEREEVIKYAKENDILFSEYAELLKNSKVQTLVQGIITKLNSGLASFESIKRFKLLPNEFSIETGELTPSLKVRRRFAAEKYKSELDSMYGTEALE